MRPTAFAGWHRIKIGLNHTAFGLSGTVFNFAFSIIIVRIYSAQLWGTFAQLMLMMTLVSQVTSWGNKDFLLREFSRSNQLSSLWQTSLFSRVIIFIPLIPVFFVYSFNQQETYLLGIWCFANFFSRSFDSVIVFERKFGTAVGIEMVGFAVIVALLSILPKAITPAILIILFIITASLKTALYVLSLRKTILESFQGAFSRHHLVLSIPYFLPPFISFINAKADTFAIALTLPGKELGEYYVLVSLLSYCHAIAALALVPFLKNIYRIRLESLHKIKMSFFLGGIAWSILCMVCIYFSIEYIYQIHFDAPVYLVAAFALPPFFIYYLLSQEFFRHDKPYPVVIINLLAAILNFIVSLLLINFFGFVGGLMSFASMQWILLLGFVVAQREFFPKPKGLAQ